MRGSGPEKIEVDESGNLIEPPKPKRKLAIVSYDEWEFTIFIRIGRNDKETSDKLFQLIEEYDLGIVEFEHSRQSEWNWVVKVNRQYDVVQVLDIIKTYFNH